MLGKLIRKENGLTCMGKKKFLPKDMQDLEDIYYNPENAERKRRYESYIDSEVIDQTREAEAKRIMSNFGLSIKIPTVAGMKRPDFRIDESKIVYEITSMQCTEQERITQTIAPRSEKDFINDVNKSMEHALEKDYSGFDDYRKVVIIFIDSILSGLCHYTEYSTPEIIKKTIFGESDISCLIIAPVPNSMSKAMKFTAYAKDDDFVKLLKEKLSTEFNAVKL